MTASSSAGPLVVHADAARITELALRWQEHADHHAREQLFDQFRPLARKLAGRYSNPYEPLDDLVQVAYIGLLGAVDRYDPRRGVRFPAFAIPTILGELKRYFRNTGWSAHVPRGAQEMALRVERAVRELTAASGRPPSVPQVAEFLELDVEDVLIGLDAGSAHYSVSLDAPAPGIEAEDQQSLGEGMGDGDDGYGLVETKLSLTSAIAQLPHLERRALTLRIDGDLKQTEVAQAMGCSQMQVSRLLRRAATHLRELTDPELNRPRP